MYLCWRNGKVLGLATSKKNARKMCSNTGDCYMGIIPNTVIEEDIEVTPLCTHNTQFGFLTYDEAYEIVEELVKRD